MGPLILRVMLLITISVGAACSRGSHDHSTVADSRAVDVRGIVDAGTRPAYAAVEGLWREVRRFYGQNGYHAAWNDGGRLTSASRQLTAAIERAADDGLEPPDYDAQWLHVINDKPAPASAAEVDVRLTYDY